MNQGAEFFTIQAEILIEKGVVVPCLGPYQEKQLLLARLLPPSCNCPVTTQPPPARAHQVPCTALDCILQIEQEE